MPLIPINKGTAPNNGTGTTARAAADIINSNFAYLNGRIDAAGLQPEISVSAIWTGTGLVFDVVADLFTVGGVAYTANPDTVTLDAAHATLDRIDLIVAIKPVSPATVGTVGFIKGDPASTALVVPPDYDPSTYFVIKQITVRAAATEPEGFDNMVIFDDDLPGEWDAILFGGNAAINTSDPSTGTDCIEFTAASSSDYVVFTAPAPISTADLDILKFDLKLKQVATGKFLVVKLRLTGVNVSQLSFNSGTNGYDDSNLNYQTITIDKSDFNAPIADFDEIQMFLYDTGSTGYYLDNVKMFTGSGYETNPDNYIQDAPADGGIYGRRNNGWEAIVSSEIIVKDKSQIINQVLDSTKIYKIDTQITLLDGESIIVPETGLTLDGHGFNISTIFSSADNHTIFTSPVGGSGDLVLSHLSLTTVGVNSKVFDIHDVDGTHAIEVEYVNFSGCTSLGKQAGYRQGTWTTVGVYGCDDGLQLSGTWNGYKVSNSNCFGFGAAGTLFKKDVDTLFNNRLFLNVNIDLPTGAVLCDFDNTNFSSNELFQINSSIAKLNGVIDINNSNILVPNISPNDLKCLWIGNIGLADSATEVLVEDDTVTGAYEIDWLEDTYFLTMTGNTIFSEVNLPASTKNTQEIKVYLTGNFVPTFPAGWEVNQVGTYKGSEINEIAIKYIKAGLYFVKISNSLTVYPAPILGSIVPVSLIPGSTTELRISGSFYTPQGFVILEGQVVNTIEFDPDTGDYVLSVTAGMLEGEFDITISNGTSVTFSNKLIVNLGDVFIPSELEWESSTGADVTEYGAAKIIVFGSAMDAIWEKEFDFTKDWVLRFTPTVSPLGNYAGGTDFGIPKLTLRRVSDNVVIFKHHVYSTSASPQNMNHRIETITDSAAYSGSSVLWQNMKNSFELRYVSGVLYCYRYGVLTLTLTQTVTENLKLRIVANRYDYKEIKYIETP